MVQTFVSLGITTILWVTIGYSLCFSGGEGGIIGNFDLAFLEGMSFNDAYTNGKVSDIYILLPTK
jgi:Amt family ammonium transporter